MKKIRLLALLTILMAVFVNGYAGGALDCTLRCDSNSDPSLCTDGEDTGCSEFCGSSAQCNYYGFYNVYGTCAAAPAHRCVCRGCNDG
jgi:hypothetical protein